MLFDMTSETSQEVQSVSPQAPFYLQLIHLHLIFCKPAEKPVLFEISPLSFPSCRDNNGLPVAKTIGTSQQEKSNFILRQKFMLEKEWAL